jgi:hypothetical protein
MRQIVVVIAILLFQFLRVQNGHYVNLTLPPLSLFISRVATIVGSMCHTIERIDRQGYPNC